jgi:hypothetical protein
MSSKYATEKRLRTVYRVCAGIGIGVSITILTLASLDYRNALCSDANPAFLSLSLWLIVQSAVSIPLLFFYCFILHHHLMTFFSLFSLAWFIVGVLGYYKYDDSSCDTTRVRLIAYVILIGDFVCFGLVACCTVCCGSMALVIELRKCRKPGSWMKTGEIETQRLV